MSDFTHQLVAACHPETRTIPADVRRIAEHSLLDWLSVLVGGLDQSVTQIVLQEAVENGSSPLSTIPGLRQRVSLRDAARINGTASHALDFDDTHLPSRVHPSTPLWPAILAQAEALDRTGHHAINAFIAGVELQSRLAAVFGESHYALGWHNTATLGTFGAAFANGILLKLDQRQLVTALGIAASFSSGPRLQFGSDAKALQCGSAAANGLHAARLAQRGFTAHPAVFDEASGFMELVASSASRNIERERWYTRDIVYKFHASCYGTQAPIVAAQAVTSDSLPQGPVRVWIEPQYLSVCNISVPQTVNEARFSVRHMVAMAVLERDTVSETGLARSLNDGQIAALRERIFVDGDSNLARASARVLFGNGFTSRAVLNKPELNHELQLARLKKKSSRLMADTFSDQQVAQIHQKIAQFDSELSVASFCESLIPPEK